LKLKTYLAAFISAALIILGGSAAYASGISIIADGAPVTSDVAPRIINDRTMVPMRAIFEALGADVYWEDSTKTVTGVKNNKTVVLQVGNSVMINNGAETVLDTPPVIAEGRTLVPVRAIAEGLNARVSWNGETRTVYIYTTDGKELKVSFIDVGQGDSELIVFPDGKTMLIDAGSAGTGVTQYIKSRGISRLDFVLVTHNHEDHIGGMAEVIRSFDIGEIYMPEKPHTTKTFENMLLAIDAKGLRINKAKAGVVIYEDFGIKAELLGPAADFEDLNNTSAILKLTYSDTAFIFTGDAEVESLGMLTGNLDSDVYKVGHHGSSNATTEVFLDAVSPEYAVISCGVGNSYGHPHSEVLAMLARRGIKVYRTDECGTVTVTSDGEKITVDKNSSVIAPNAPPVFEQTVTESNASVVYRTKTGKKYHRSSCSHLKSGIEITVAEAEAAGLEPCKLCKP